MGNAEVDQARFLAAGDDLDREAERGLGLLQEFLGVFGDAEGVGADGAHRVARQAAQALAEAAKAGQRAVAGVLVEGLVRAQAGAKADGFFQRIERVDLVVHHPGDLQPEAVGAEIDRGNGGVLAHC